MPFAEIGYPRFCLLYPRKIKYIRDLAHFIREKSHISAKLQIYPRKSGTIFAEPTIPLTIFSFTHFLVQLK
ncbi:hypothetical protein CVD25_02350 [Bacillus canaveralius]|uniref:Uncharacterized protein n=1 Tax=Bacillus canaveralius TaxID=1403243 RepID=A0A2N5GP87_9BACI|nr:hypothetical protein CU635_06445 [Bacillus canaveralius]PLR87027.1 hypothetical protein CVD23_05190 [Bacillus sp. V33-4]PLS00609.1 hypothetical protein CVD25_02350 [Bacillus canaveralius]